MHFKIQVNMRPGWVVAAFLTSSTLLIGCTVDSVHNSKSIGLINSQSEARQVVRLGMSMAQVESKLGRPSGRSTFNSKTTWVYGTASAPLSRKNVLSGSLTGVIIPDRKTVVITFNGASRVSQVDYSEQINS